MKKTLLTVILCLISSVVVAQNMTFEWDPVTAPGLTISEYRVYMSDQSGVYTGAPEWSGPGLTCVIDVPAGTHYLVVTAVSTSGDESGFSNEDMEVTPPNPTNFRRVIKISGQIVIE